MAGCHLRERHRVGAVRFPVIRQLQARRIAGAVSEQRLAVGSVPARASAWWPGGCTGLERGLDGVGDELGGLRVYPLTATVSQCLTGHYGHCSWKSSIPTT